MRPQPSRDKPSVNQPLVTGYFDQSTHTISYVVEDPTSKACAIIDSVIDLDYAGGRTSFDHAQRLIRHVADRGLEVVATSTGKPRWPSNAPGTSMYAMALMRASTFACGRSVMPC